MTSHQLRRERGKRIEIDWKIKKTGEVAPGITPRGPRRTGLGYFNHPAPSIRSFAAALVNAVSVKRDRSVVRSYSGSDPVPNDGHTILKPSRLHSIRITGLHRYYARLRLPTHDAEQLVY